MSQHNDFFEHEVWGAGPIFVLCHLGDEQSEKITILMRESCILNTPSAPYFNTCLVSDFPVFFITGLLPHFAPPCPARYKDESVICGFWLLHTYSDFLFVLRKVACSRFQSTQKRNRCIPTWPTFCSFAANINDRSMLGKRDSEIAAIIKDKEFVSIVWDLMVLASICYCSNRQTKIE